MIEAAEPVVEFLTKQSAVKKITLGYIDNYASRSGGVRVKIIYEKACVLLSITGGGANQEVRVFCRSGEKRRVAQRLQAEFPDVSFSKLDRRR